MNSGVCGGGGEEELAGVKPRDQAVTLAGVRAEAAAGNLNKSTNHFT